MVRWPVAIGGIDGGRWVGREDGWGRTKVRGGREARTLALVLDWWGRGRWPQ